MDFPDQKRDSSFWAIEVSLRTCLWPIAQVNILHVVKLEKTSFILEWFFRKRGSIYYFYCKGLHAVLPGMHFLPPNLKF